MLFIDLSRASRDPDDPSLPIAERFESLRDYLDLLEEFVPTIVDQVLLRARARINHDAHGYEPGELRTEVLATQRLATHTIPVQFLGAFVVALSSALEVSLEELSEYVRKIFGSEATPKKDGVSDVAHLLRCIEAQTGADLKISASVRKHIDDTILVRNVFAHANGLLARQAQGRRERIGGLVSENGGMSLQNGYVVAEPVFLRRSLEAAVSLLQAILFALEAAPPSNGA